MRTRHVTYDNISLSPFSEHKSTAMKALKVPFATKRVYYRIAEML